MCLEIQFMFEKKVLFIAVWLNGNVANFKNISLMNIVSTF